MGAGLAGAAAVVVGVTGMAEDSGTPGGFDRAAWIAAGGLPLKSDARAPMAAGLEGRLAGLSRGEVEALLGAPEEVLGDSYVYYLSQVLFGAEHRVLLVDFDAAGMVASARDVSTETWQ